MTLDELEDKLVMLLRQCWDYKPNLNVFLVSLSWPLFIGGQVSRSWSGSIQIHHIWGFTYYFLI
jgi:hypothetical protein